MPFVHLANGEILDLTDEEWQQEQEKSGTPNAVHRDGKGSHVIGVYQGDYEYDDTSEKAAADKRAQDAEDEKDREEFAEWKRNRDDNAERDGQ